ncbi:hypothetical protein LINGRAHAP2_LOCUS6872 [Linum grandiflorum]
MVFHQNSSHPEVVVVLKEPLIKKRHQKTKASEMAKFVVMGMLLLLCWSCVDFGSSEKIGSYELKKGNMSLKVTNYGAHMMSFIIPDKHGKLNDVILGYDTAEAYKDFRVM